MKKAIINLSFKTVLSVFFLLFYASKSFGQSGWEILSSGTTEYLADVSFTDVNTGTVVGWNGTILRTTDGGTTWKKQISGTTNILLGVCFVNANIGTVVGWDGTILRTTDGGTTWTTQISNTPFILSAVHFVDANIGTAVGAGGIILHTTNGGSTWINQPLGIPHQVPLEGVSFVNANIGTIVGDEGTILRTTNGGSSWTALSSGTTAFLHGISTTDINNITAVGNFGTILRTTNEGGTVWTKQNAGTTERISDVSFVDPNIGTAVGYSGKIFHTTNGGKIWNLQSSGTTEYLYGVSFVDSSFGVAVGSNGTILRTTSKPTIPGWNHIVSPGDFLTIFFIDSTNGWIGGNDGIAHTVDGGANWAFQTIPTNVNVNRILFLTKNIGFAVGGNVRGTDGTVLKTTDAGQTWIQKRSGNGLNSIYFLNSQHGWACGGDSILVTSDQGETWSAHYAQVVSSHWDIAFKNSEEGWVVGLYGSCYKSMDGGNSWNSSVAPISGRSLFAICFPDPTKGVIVGGEQIALSTNGGTSWSTVYNSGGSQLNSISFADALNGWVVGTDKIVKTSDGGITWKEQSWPSPYGYLNAVHAPDKEHVYAIGDKIILKTINGGGAVTSIASNKLHTPLQYNLFQNYPNPFNPETEILFSIPTRSRTTIIIYDALGREIHTLLDKETDQGNYSISWNGTNALFQPAPSGIYFYRIQSGQFVQTKKMILLR